MARLLRYLVTGRQSDMFLGKMSVDSKAKMRIEFKHSFEGGRVIFD